MERKGEGAWADSPGFGVHFSACVDKLPPAQVASVFLSVNGGNNQTSLL